MRAVAAIGVLGALAAMPDWGRAQALVNQPTLSVDAAQEIAAAALAHCRKEGHQVSVTVLDRTGRPIVTLRDNGASPHSYEHSLRKAYTALTYNMPSAEYGKRAAGSQGAIGPQLLPHITTAAGGLPIRAGDAVVGAVGVSGTPGKAGGGAADAQCGQPGIDRVAKGLGPGG
jgi:uncharacterized protein GlcG (DUF336 family)